MFEVVAVIEIETGEILEGEQDFDTLTGEDEDGVVPALIDKTILEGFGEGLVGGVGGAFEDFELQAVNVHGVGDVHGAHHAHACGRDVVELPDLGVAKGDGFIFGDGLHLEGAAVDVPVHLEHL